MTVKLGLIGSGIGRSRAPTLHALAGRLCGLEVTYSLRPLEGGGAEAFRAALEACVADGYRGVNVTHPFKEAAAGLVTAGTESVARLGAVNTVRLDEGWPCPGFNTDHSGFIAAFRARFPGESPGVVGIAGAGGVGRSVAMGLAQLGASELRLLDPDCGRAERLAAAVRAGFPSCVVRIADGLDGLTRGTDGLANCSPLGMHQYPGTSIEARWIGSQRWAFDAVYTPPDTRFIQAARVAGLEVLCGFELFFHQGLDAFEVFTGRRVDAAALRRALAEAEAP